MVNKDVSRRYFMTGSALAVAGSAFAVAGRPHYVFGADEPKPSELPDLMTVPQGAYERPYMKDRIRIAKDGYVYAPTKPGLGYEIDRDELDRITKRIES